MKIIDFNKGYVYADIHISSKSWSSDNNGLILSSKHYIRHPP